jgi:hypothetical protein
MPDTCAPAQIGRNFEQFFALVKAYGFNTYAAGLGQLRNRQH